MPTIPLSSLQPPAHSPPTVFDDRTLDGLVASIKTDGLLQNLVVTPVKGKNRYRIVSGERRYRGPNRHRDRPRRQRRREGNSVPQGLHRLQRAADPGPAGAIPVGARSWSAPDARADRFAEAFFNATGAVIRHGGDSATTPRSSTSSRCRSPKHSAMPRATAPQRRMSSRTGPAMPSGSTVNFGAKRFGDTGYAR